MLARALILFLAAAAVSLAAPAAKAQNPLGLIDSAKFTWGTSATFPPFESLVDGKPVGFDIDLVDAMMTKVHLQSAPVLIDFKGLIPALLGRRLDTIISGVYINPERSAVVDFIPYLRIGNQMVVAKGNPLHLKTTAELCGHKVAAAVGTVFEKEALQLVAECKSGGKPELSLLSPPNTGVSALSLKEGRVDAIVVSVPTALSLMKESPDAYDIAGEPFDNDTILGIGFGKGKTALKDAVDAALKAVVADGTYAKIIKKYGLPDSSSMF